MDFKWDRRFGDDTVAPLGTYDVKVIATDKMGNRTQANATINILLGILPPGPAATPQPYVRVDSTPTPASSPAPFVTPTASLAPVTSIFGSTPDPSLALAPGNDQTQGSPAAQIESIPGTIATPRAAPTQTTFMDWLESIFVPNTPEETVTDVSTPEADSNMHWDATLAAMAAAVTAYTLAEKRKREEEEAPLTKFQQKLRAEKTHDMKTQEALMREIAQFNAEQERLEAEKQREQNERMEAKMARVDMEDDAKWVASQVVIQRRAEEEKKTEEVQAGLAAYYSAMRQGEQEAQTAYEMYVIRQEVEESKKSNELQTGMAAYYSAMRQGEQEAQTNWWEKTKSFVNGKIIQPVNESIYQPVIKPALQGATEAAAAVITRLNEDIYRPVSSPK